MVAGTAIGIGAAAGLVPAAQAVDYTVTNTADTGPGSLRDAMEQANGSVGVDDRIVFQSTLTGTITLTNSLPYLDESMEIVGPGADKVTIDGAEAYNFFRMNGDGLEISGLTLRDGQTGAGGAIRAISGVVVIDDMAFAGNTTQAGGAGAGVSTVGESLTITDSEFTGNTADASGGAVSANASELAISGSTFTDNDVNYPTGGGGAVSISSGVDVPATITGSEFSGNEGGFGGAVGISTVGTVVIDSSLITGNTGLQAGAGIVTFGAGDFTVRNSTLTGNTTTGPTGFGAAILSGGSGLKVESSTITGNTVTTPFQPFAGGAGIAQASGEMTLTNSIVSGNQPADVSTGPATPSPPAPVPMPAGQIDGAFNLIGARAAGTVFNETVAGSNLDPAAPQLGPLADNGGPTRTMLPADTSPVVNKGASALTVDQRGLARPVDLVGVPLSTAAGANGADIGAVEVQQGPIPPPPDCQTDPALCPPPPPPGNAFSFGKVKLNKKKGTATLQVKVPGAGKVLLLGSKTVVKSSKSAKAKATVNLTVKAKGKAARQLKNKGKAKVTAKVRFSPTGGTARTKSKAVKLVRKKPKRK